MSRRASARRRNSVNLPRYRCAEDGLGAPDQDHRIPVSPHISFEATVKHQPNQYMGQVGRLGLEPGTGGL
jgi:hypothetical protein